MSSLSGPLEVSCLHCGGTGRITVLRCDGKELEVSEAFLAEHGDAAKLAGFSWDGPQRCRVCDGVGIYSRTFDELERSNVVPIRFWSWRE